MTQTTLLAPTVAKHAEISACGRYRYSLARIWDEAAYSLPIIMLNPSTADADNDDPTIRRCMSFARRERFGGIVVMNLFAFRATSPADMKAAGVDAVGPDNDTRLGDLIAVATQYGTPILAAWGAHGDYRGRAAEVRKMAAAAGLQCLGQTDKGHPRHPLYVPGNQPLEWYP